jgi:hypothetical protein
MQLLLEYLDPPPPPAVPAPPPWDRLDQAARAAALEILGRLIARMLAAKQAQESRRAGDKQ